MLIKICGMKSQDDLDLAARTGFDFCGFVFHPKSPRYIPPEAAARLDSGPMRRVGVFVDQDAEEIINIMTIARLDFAQLHGSQSMECARAIGSEKAVRVLWPERYDSPESLMADAGAYASSCAYYLLDAGTSGGGSGNALTWRNLAGLFFPRPWLLAGGLSPHNVLQAIKSCNPAGLDFNSGLEFAPGIKDRAKINLLMEILQNSRETTL